MDRKHFIELFKTLSKEEQKEVEKHWLDVYKNAVFPETFDIAEQTLNWIIDATS